MRYSDTFFVTKLKYDSVYYKPQRHEIGAANISKSAFIKIMSGY